MKGPTRKEGRRWWRELGRSVGWGAAQLAANIAQRSRPRRGLRYRLATTNYYQGTMGRELGRSDRTVRRYLERLAGVRVWVDGYGHAPLVVWRRVPDWRARAECRAPLTPNDYYITPAALRLFRAAGVATCTDRADMSGTLPLKRECRAAEQRGRPGAAKWPPGGDISLGVGLPAWLPDSWRRLACQLSRPSAGDGHGLDAERVR